MKIIVTGGNGMLAKALIPALEEKGHKVRALAKSDLNVTNYMQVMDLFTQIQPELVIHAAAYTKVDLAETEAREAYLVNGYGTENIAVACAAVNSPMLYVSTDYVFDGTTQTPYTTWDKTNPISIYGKSKLAGEVAVERHLDRYYIVRTSWLYGVGGPNFVETMLRLATEREVISVVQDQRGTPTSTKTLSSVLTELITTDRWGVYHATDGGDTTWFEFAREILKGKPVEVRPIETKDYPRPASRPAYSILDKTTLVETIGRQLVPWQEALQDYLNVRLQKQPA